MSYPANWFRIPISGILFITSTRRRVEAVVIPRGAQMISVREAEPVSENAYFQASELDYILAQWRLRLRPKGDPRRCSDVVVIESSDEVGPHTSYLEHHMFCKIRDRLFILSLTQWKDDKPNKAAYEVAVKMLKSLRTS